MNDFPESVPLTGRVRICLELVKSVKTTGKVIVDIGASFGWLEKEIIKTKPKEMIGIEPNKAAIDFATKNVKTAKFLVGDALNTKIKDNYADVVTLFDVIEHVPEGSEISVLKEANRILKKEGILLLSTPNAHLIARMLDLAWYFGHRHYSKADLEKMLSEGGFAIKKIEARGSFYSSFYLFWFYITKKVTGNSQPRNHFLEKKDDQGYDSGKITDIFLIATKI